MERNDRDIEMKSFLKEISATCDVAGYDTPYAFSTKGPNSKRLKDIRKWCKIFGWEAAKGINLNEELEPEDYSKIKELIRAEIAIVMFDLFKKRKAWM